MTEIYYHEHHIIPKHMGGSNDPSNLIVLTVEEHSEAHRLLFLHHGKQEDYIAWLALAGINTMSETKRLVQSLGLKNATEAARLSGKSYLGGNAVRDKKLGIHNPNNIHLKSLGGKLGVIHLPKFTKQSKWMNNGIKDTRVLLTNVDKYVLNGWKIGRLYSPNKGKIGKTINTIWINRDNKNKRIFKEQIELYKSNGWNEGMYIKEQGVKYNV